MENNTEQKLMNEAKAKYPDNPLDFHNKIKVLRKGWIAARRLSLSELEEAKKSMFTREQVEKMLLAAIEWTEKKHAPDATFMDGFTYEADKQTTIDNILNNAK